jgi:hypothetical protein
MAEGTDYYQKYISEIVGGMMPSLQTQKKGMYDFTMATALRTGQPASNVAEGMRPYADAAGEAAAGASTQAASMAQRQEQFDVGQENWEKSFSQGQENWEASMKLQKEQQNTANMISMFNATGWTQELLDAMGYDAGSAGGRGFQRMLDDLGFANPPGTGGSNTSSDVGGYWDRTGGGGAYNNWGGKTGLIYG